MASSPDQPNEAPFLTLHIPKLFAGAGAIGRLPQILADLGCHRPLLMSDRGLSAAGILDRVCAALPFRPAIFDQVTENPIFADCDAAAALFNNLGCDIAIALGGGSVLDAAKLTCVVAGHHQPAVHFGGHSERITAATIPLVAVPTTAGTGSDASPAAGVHPHPTARSAGISSPWIVPKVSVADVDLTLSLPPRLTAATGLDALSHCIEAYLSPTPSPLIDAMALDGIRRVHTYLDRATANGQDIEARHHMLLAAFTGGVAIAKGLGPAHAIAITCGDQSIHHGQLSAIGLLPTLDLLAVHCPEKIADIAEAMGLGRADTPSDALRAWMRRLGLPDSLAAAGYRLADLDELAGVAEASYFNRTSPYHPSRTEYAAMLSSIAR